jgi:hypothetical protein
MITTRINKIRNTQTNQGFLDDDNLSEDDLILSINELIGRGVSPLVISQYVLPELGYSLDSLPKKVLDIIEG